MQLSNIFQKGWQRIQQLISSIKSKNTKSYDLSLFYITIEGAAIGVVGKIIKETKNHIYIVYPKALVSSSSDTFEQVMMMEWSPVVDTTKPMIVDKTKILYRCFPSQKIAQSYESMMHNIKISDVQNENSDSPFLQTPLTQEEQVLRAMAFKQFANPTEH